MQQGKNEAKVVKMNPKHKVTADDKLESFLEQYVEPVADPIYDLFSTNKGLKKLALGLALSAGTFFGGKMILDKMNGAHAQTIDNVVIEAPAPVKENLYFTTITDDTPIEGVYETYAMNSQEILDMIVEEVEKAHPLTVKRSELVDKKNYEIKNELSKERLIEEVVSQIFQESRLMHVDEYGKITTSPKNAYGAGQFLAIGARQTNKYMLEQKQFDEYFTQADKLDIDLMFTPTKEGARENIRGTVIFNQLMNARYRDPKTVNAEYHDGLTYLTRAKKKSDTKSNRYSQFGEHMTDNGQEYVDLIEGHKRKFKDVEQFHEYAIAQYANVQMLDERKIAKKQAKKLQQVKNGEVQNDSTQQLINQYRDNQIKAYEKIVDLYQHLKVADEDTKRHRQLNNEAQAKLGVLYQQKGEYETALEHANAAKNALSGFNRTPYENSLYKDSKYIAKLAKSKING